ncbi:TLC domain-containing protein [Mycena metata]|uniref:TLC domain-containing protein n=1 Tax=Mycena metata TaxID=1033252 RepID=A0AAD7NU65_9AGAR|nr:TLC domain-containing protein [Mycena metata]
MNLPTIDQALPRLNPHLSVLLTSFALFNVVHLVVVPILARVLVAAQWKDLNARARNNWAVHICSQLHAIIILPLALRCLALPELDADRAFGWHERSGTVQAVACGYFLWDTIESLVNFEDIGFVLHGLACLAIYLLSFQPFLAYYASRCLLWEASTFFLNIHWALDKMNRTGGTFQLVNGVFLLLTFFSVRLVYGGITSYQFFQTLYNGRQEIAPVALAITGVGNILLQSLNWFWFAKMITALRKRFTPAKKHQNGVAQNGVGVPQNGLHKKND